MENDNAFACGAVAKSYIKRTMYPSIEENIMRLFPESRGFSMPELYFSDEEPQKETYGDLKPNAVQKELAKIREQYRDVPASGNIVGALTGPEAKYVLYDWMSGNKKSFPDWAKDLIDKVKKILAREEVSITVSGLYDAENNRIIIFSKTFEEYSELKKAAQIRMTIAHEVFHALHKYLAPRTFEEGSYYAEIVREAMADFYAYLFCLNRDAAKMDGVNFNMSETAAHDRYSFWGKCLFTAMPYPNAIFHMYRSCGIAFDETFADCMNNGSFGKLKEILQTSENDMYRAYLDLVPEPFRKDPPPKYRSSNRRVGKHIVSGTLQVSDIGFADGSFSIDVWDILKKIICDNDIGSLEELQDFFPKDIIRFVRGRFITLESGEILSAYPQWEIADEVEFKKFAARAGYLTPLYTVLMVDIGGGKIFSYRLESNGAEEVQVGDKVRCLNKKGCQPELEVLEIIYMTEREYHAFCERIGYSELSAAKKAQKKVQDDLVPLDD